MNADKIRDALSTLLEQSAGVDREGLDEVLDPRVYDAAAALETLQLIERYDARTGGGGEAHFRLVWTVLATLLISLVGGGTVPAMGPIRLLLELSGRLFPGQTDGEGVTVVRMPTPDVHDADEAN